MEQAGRESAAAAGFGSAALAAVVVVASALHFLGGQVADPDLWQHLRFGDMIWRDGAIPRVDTFSYTAFGEPLIDHEWLTQWIFAGLFAAGGSAALVGLKLALSAATILLLLDAVRTLESDLGAARTHPLTVAAGLVLGLAVIAPGATFRPQLFTIASLAAEAALLARADRRLRASDVGRGATSWELLLVPPLLAIWANLHGGFLIGVALLGTWVVAVLWRAVSPRIADGERPTRGQAVRVALVGLAGLAAPLLNPYGVGLYEFLGRTIEMHDEIGEWWPVPLWSTDFLRFKILVLAAVAGIAILWRGRAARPATRALLDWRAPFLVLAAIYGFRHQRHTVLFAVVAIPLVTVAAERVRLALLASWPALRPRPPVFAAAALGVLAVVAVQLRGIADVAMTHGTSIRFGRLDFPVDALEFMRTHDITGNVAMPFEWGSFAIWKFAPESRVFIDGRFETVYPPRVIDDYFAFMHGGEGWERLLDDYPTDVVVVQRWRNIHPRLFQRRDFAYVYSDPASLVFVRRSPQNQPALDRLASASGRTAFEPPETVFP